MRTTSRSRLAIAIAILLLVGGGLLLHRPGFVLGRASRAVGSIFSFPARIFSGAPHMAASLLEENRRLHAEIALLSQVIPQKERELYEAHVFSSYPFNNRALIEIDAGSEAGLREGMAVSADGVFLVGSIESVSPYASVVKTIFDNDVSLPVVIGEGRVDALLVGGRTPRLTLIVKGAEIMAGDEVYSSGSDFPYGLLVGKVAEIRKDAGGAFSEALVQVPYDPGGLRTVSVFLL